MNSEQNHREGQTRQQNMPHLAFQAHLQNRTQRVIIGNRKLSGFRNLKEEERLLMLLDGGIRHHFDHPKEGVIG